jgi:hypothetical protein
MSEFEQPIVDDRNPRTFVQFMPVVFVLLLAAWLRIIGGDHFPVSTDEGWSTWAIAEPTFRAIWDVLAADRHPPLYFIALGYWSRIAGDSHLALRLPSMLMGVLTVAMIYRIGADTFGRTARPGREDVAWYGMLMFAILPVAVYYSQEIRHYGWFVASAVWSSLLFVRILRTPRIHLLVMYCLSVAIMFYILYFAMWVMLLHVFTGIVLWRGNAARDWMVPWREKGKLAITWAIVLVLYFPWIIVIATQQWGILTSGITAAPGTFTSSLRDLLLLSQLLLGGGLALTAGLYVIGFWGSLVSDRTDVTLGLRFANPAWLGELFIVMWGLGLFTLLALVNLWTGVLSARTTVFLSPALMLVVGAGIVRLRVGVRWSLLAGYVGVSLILPPIIQPRLDYHVTAKALASQVAPGDIVVLETGWDDNAFRYEIGLQLGPDVEIIRTLPWVNNRDENVPVMPQIEETLLSHERVWVVQWLQPSQVIPGLTELGYTETMTLFTDVGEQYRGQFTDFGASDQVRLVRLAHPTDMIDMPTFGDMFTLTGAALPENAIAGSDFVVDLWWTVDETPELDYSVGLFLLNNQEVVTDMNLSMVTQTDAIYRYTEADGLFFADPATFVEQPTSMWEASVIQPTRYVMSIPPDTPAGDYTLALRIYYFEEPDKPLRVNEDEQYSLGIIQLENR